MGIFDTIVGGLRGAYDWVQQNVFGRKLVPPGGEPTAAMGAPAESQENELRRIAEEKMRTEQLLAEEEKRRKDEERRAFERQEELAYSYEEGPKKNYMVQVQLQWVCFNSYGEVVKRYFEDTTPKGVVVSATSPDEAVLLAGSSRMAFWGPNLTRTGQSPDMWAKEQWNMLPNVRRRAFNQNEGTDEIVKPSGCFVGGHVEVSADTIEEDSERRMAEMKQKRVKPAAQRKL